MKKRDIIIIIVAVIAVLVVGAGIGYASMNYLKSNNKKDFKQERKIDQREDDKRIDREIAKIDSIDGRTIVLTLGDIQKPEIKAEDSQDKSNEKNIEEDFKATEEKVTLTAPDNIDISAFKVGDIVSISFNDNNEITFIGDFSDIKVKGNKPDDREIGIVDSIENNTIVITKGDLQKNNTNKTENSDITEDFVPGDEKLTLTVNDVTLLENIKAGDIVSFKYSDSNLEEIKVFGEDFKNFSPKDGKDQRNDSQGNQMNQSKDNQRNQKDDSEQENRSNNI